MDKSAGLSFEPETLKTGHAWKDDHITVGGNSGYQALNLAAQLGFKRIILLGYDMKPGPNGELHHHGDHPEPLNNPDSIKFEHWREGFKTTLPDLKRAGISVINCTRDTALDCFPKVNLRHAL